MTFKSDIVDDISDIFDLTDEFTTAATYTPSGGSATTINVFLDNVYFPVPGAFVEIESTQPMAHCKSADISSVAHGDTIVIDSVTYLVMGVHNSSIGITTLILETQ